jgi:hypothetical protein
VEAGSSALTSFPEYMTRFVAGARGKCRTASVQMHSRLARQIAFIGREVRLAGCTLVCFFFGYYMQARG